jgi:hypothetical protein
VKSILSEAHKPHDEKVIGFLTLALSSHGAGQSHEKMQPTVCASSQEDRRAPTAVHMVWYRAGSMDEWMAPRRRPCP